MVPVLTFETSRASPNALYTRYLARVGLTPLLLALSRGHLKLLPVLEHASMDTSEGSAVQRQVECNSSEGSASGGMWISFKSRLRLSLRRRPQQQLAHAVGRETSREAKADQVRGREMAVPVNSKSMTDRSHHNSSDEEKQNETHRQEVKPYHHDVDVGTRHLNSPSEQRLPEARERPSTSANSFHQLEVRPHPPAILADSDAESDPFDLESSSSLLFLSNYLDGGSDKKSLWTVDGDHLVSQYQDVPYELENLTIGASHDARDQLAQHTSLPVTVPQVPLQKGAKKAPACGELSNRITQERAALEQQNSTTLCYKQQQQQSQEAESEWQQAHKSGKQCTYYQRPQDNGPSPEPLTEPSQLGTIGQSGTWPPTLRQTDTHAHGDRKNSEDLNEPCLDIESVTKTTIHAAVSQCLQQLPPGLTQGMTRRATSCNSSAAATVRHNSCSCGRDGITVNLDQVVHVNTRVKKKKLYRAGNLKIGRARYLATGQHSKILYRRVVRPSTRSKKGARSTCRVGDDDGDEQEEGETGDEYDTSSSSDTTEFEDDEDHNGDNNTYNFYM